MQIGRVRHLLLRRPSGLLPPLQTRHLVFKVNGSSGGITSVWRELTREGAEGRNAAAAGNLFQKPQKGEGVDVVTLNQRNVLEYNMYHEGFCMRIQSVAAAEHFSYVASCVFVSLSSVGKSDYSGSCAGASGGGERRDLLRAAAVWCRSAKLFSSSEPRGSEEPALNRIRLETTRKRRQTNQGFDFVPF